MLLKAMRQGSTSIVAKTLFSILLFAAVIGLAMLDYNGMFSRGAHSDTVATVAGVQIPSAVFDSQVRRVLSRQSIDTKTAYQRGFIDQILQSEIADRLFSRAGYDLGIQIDDDVIAKQVNQLITPFVSKDIDRKEALKRILMNQGMSEAQFAQDMRTETANTILKTAVQSGAVTLSPQEATDLYQFQREERTVKFVVLPNSAIKDFKEPADAVLTPLYQAGQERFAIPETRSFSVLLLSPDDTKKTADISDEDVKKAYDSDPGSYAQPERRVMEQAVFQDQKTAQGAADKVKKGADLHATAGSSYVGQQTFQKDGLAPEIAGPAFAAAKGDVVGPVQTGLGWHVLVVKDVLAPETKPFDTVKDQISKDLLASRVSDDLYKESGKIDDQLAGGASLEDVAKDMGLTIKKFGPVRADGSTTDSHEGMKDFPKDRDSLLKTAFEQQEGEASPIQELKQGGYAAVRVDHITPKGYRPFAEVKDDLRKTWISDQQDVLNKDKAQAALNDLDSHTKTLDQIAIDNHVQVQTQTVKRMDPPAPPLTPTAKQKFFTIAKGINAAASTRGGYMIGSVTAIKLPDVANLPAAATKDLSDKMSQGVQDEYLAAYVDYLRDKYGVKTNNALLQQMYGGAAGDQGSNSGQN